MYVDVEGYVCKWGVPSRRHSSRLSTSVAASAGNAQDNNNNNARAPTTGIALAFGPPFKNPL